MPKQAGHPLSSLLANARTLAAAPLHPILFCLYPVVSLLAWNIQELYPAQAVRSLLVTLAGCLLLWALLGLLTHDVRRAAILTSLAGVMFFAYGHVYESLGELADLGLPLIRHRYLLPAWVALFLALAAIVQRQRASARDLTPVLNLVGLAALLLPLFSLGVFFSRTQVDEPRALRIPALELQPPRDGLSPDIYYIILDGYARSDYMTELLGLDNSGFIAFLEDRGFYVAGQSRSNHNWTSLSLASSLNLTLAQHLGANMRPGYYPTPFVGFIRHSLVRRSLEGIGYRTIGLQSGYLPTEWTDAEAYLGPAVDGSPSHQEASGPNAFEGMLLDTTLLEPVMSRLSIGPAYEATPNRNESYPHEVLRAIILSEFEHLAGPLPLERPRFVFAHIVAPHRPYLFTASGAPRDPDEPFTLLEAEDGDPGAVALYRDQAAYITDRIQQVVQSILDHSDVPPVIILQADHGSGLEGGTDERTAILNAVLIREDCRSMLYPSLTPVNTFRVVFNCYFGAQLPRVEDEVYWSKWPRQNAYEFERLEPEHSQP